MDQSKKSFLSPSKLKPTIVYLVFVLIGSTFFAILFSMLIGAIKGLDANTIGNSYLNSEIETTKEMDACKIIGSCYGTALAYLIGFLACCIWMRDEFILDFKNIKENKKFYAFYLPISAVSFAIIAVALDLLFSKWVGDSNNQSSIVEMLKSSGAVPMIISTIIFAPVVEEMIYRKALFSAMNAFPVYLSYIASTILFALPHMLSTSISSVGFHIWLLELLPYLICGALLCLIYHKSKYNIYASIFAHMLNNTIAVIMVMAKL